MFNNKGMTLIEIIIAIAIIGIIAIGILSGFSSGFSMITMGRGLTKDTFSVQQEVERAIEDIKKDIEDGNAPTPQSSELFSGSLERSVEYHPLNRQLSNGMNVSVFVTERLIQFPLYEVSDVNIEFNNGESHTYVDKSSPIARQKNEPTINDPDSVRAAEIYRWYVSRIGFNLPIHEGSFPEEIEIGSLWPSMSDFMEIKTGLTSSYKQLTNSELDQFAGRHIIHTITPGTVHGRTGSEVISNYLYISGLPYSQDLKLHLDASYINLDNSDEVPSDNNVKEWRDISSPKYNAQRNSTTSYPQLGIEGKNNSYWRFLEGNGSKMEINSSIGNTSAMTFFMAGKFKNAHINKKIIGNNRWGVGWSNKGLLEFYLKDNTGKTYSAETGIFVDPKEWYVLTGKIDSSGVSFKIAGSESMADNSGFTPMNFSLGQINLEWFEGMNLAEILIYDKALNGENIDKVEQYLISKYNPPEQSIKIDYLENQTRNVYVGNNFIMPFVTARMSNGATQIVPVNWNPSIIDTSEVGQVTATGTAASDPTETMTLTVNILPLEQFTVDFVYYGSDDEILTDSQKVYRGQSATPPKVPEREGFTFIDWDKPYNNIVIHETIRANYEINKYTVRFVNYDNSVIESQEVAHGEDAAPPTPPSRTGYTFDGWDANYSNVTSNIDVKAKWKGNQYRVTFDSNGGNTPNPSSKTVIFGEAYGELPVPTRGSRDFQGWFTSSSGGTRVEASTLLTRSENHTLFARWSGKIICTELHRQGLMSDIIFEADQEFGRIMSEKHPYVMKGYHFIADPIVYLMKKSSLFTNLISFFAEPWSVEMAYQMGAISQGSMIGKIFMGIGFILCWIIGVWISLPMYINFITLSIIILTRLRKNHIKYSTLKN